MTKETQYKFIHWLCIIWILAVMTILICQEEVPNTIRIIGFFFILVVLSVVGDISEQGWHDDWLEEQE